jgi:hypothetical protein
MKYKTVSGIHWSFWVIAIVTLIWNLMGVMNYFAQMSPDIIEAYQDSERTIIVGRPAWATAAFAIAVFGGSLGSILLLLRKSSAYYLFIASLLGVIVTMIHTLGVGINFGLGEILGIILMPLLVAVFLIWYSKHTQSKGWIG